MKPTGGHVAPRAGWWRSIRAVAWSFVGIRKGSEFREDMATIHPLHVVAVGLIGAVVFVIGLALLVNWIVAK